MQATIKMTSVAFQSTATKQAFAPNSYLFHIKKKKKNGTDHTLFRSDTTHLVC
jgi:hypothetical protein